MQYRLSHESFCIFNVEFVFSGKKENPLALLGQYSDDEEEDDEAADQPNGETKGSPTDASGEVIVLYFSASSYGLHGARAKTKQVEVELSYARPNRLRNHLI